MLNFFIHSVKSGRGRERQVRGEGTMTYLLDESCVATWMVSNVHITIMNGMITCKNNDNKNKML